MKLPRHSKVCVAALGSPQKDSQKNHQKSRALPVQSKKAVQKNESCPSLVECLTGNFMCPKRPVVSRELLCWEGVCFTMDWEASAYPLRFLRNNNAALGSRCVVIISNYLLVCPLESANIADITEKLNCQMGQFTAISYYTKRFARHRDWMTFCFRLPSSRFSDRYPSFYFQEKRVVYIIAGYI